MTLQPIISKKHAVMLIPCSDKLAQLWPDAKTLKHNGGVYTLIPHAPREQIMLRAVGIEAPAPVLSYYDWEGGEPFAVQKTTVALMTSYQRAYVLNSFGTGKTRSALWAWRYLNRAGCAGKLLVIAPLSTLKFTWGAEVAKTMPGVKAVVLHGSAKKRRELLAQHADIYIINHDGLKVIAHEIHARTDINCLVLDELAVYRNNSIRSKTMREFSKRFAWVWGMTGAPCPNAPTDIWAQVKILTPDRCPKYFRHAQSELMTQVSQYKWVPRAGALDTALGWMQPSVRFALDDVQELPECIYRTLDVDLSNQQTRAYRRMANELALMVENKQVTAANAGVALGKLLQIGCGYVYSANPEYVTLDSEARQRALLDIIEEAPHKLIVFAPWRHLQAGLSALLTDEGIDHAVVHGETPKRELIFNAFQSTQQYRVLLAHPGCVHHGLTLTAASTIVWYSPVPSLEIYEQANARIRRVGQQNKQQFLHLSATPAEKRIYALLRNKARLQDEFLEMLKTQQENTTETIDA